MRLSALTLASLLMAGTTAFADSITVDEILYPMSDVTAADAADYSGTVDMSFSGSTLTIVLTNTTTYNSGIAGANSLLTGVGFTLPGSLYITGGNANADGETAVQFTMPTGGDLSEEWGFDTQGLDSGALLDQATNTYDDAVSSMESQTTAQFQSGSIAQPVNLDGPDFGLLSANYSTSELGNGLEGVQDSIVIELTLSGSWNAKGGSWTESDLLKAIDGGAVALTFGSPTTGGNGVPVPGTLALFGVALGAGWFVRRRGRST